MKAITLTQPWATLVAKGGKSIETRSWKTNYRGPLAIHAAKGFPQEARALCGQEPFRFFLYPNCLLPRGVIVATCELVTCLFIPGAQTKISFPYRHDSMTVELPPREPEFSFGDYTQGRYAWILINIKPLDRPVPAKGALGLWEWSEPVVAQVI